MSRASPHGPPEYSDQPDAALPRQVFSPPTHPYYRELREWFELDRRIGRARSELGRARAICTSVHGRWRHSNDDEPSRNDAITILREAAKGRRFRCVQYAVVLSGGLNAFGIPARVVSMMSSDVESRPSGASHVVCEMWLGAMAKWALIDAQENAIVTMDSLPLNCVEIASRLGSPNIRVDIPDLPPGVDPGRYLSPNGFGSNFCYFQTRVDQRPTVHPGEGASILLVPKGAVEPKVFQGFAPFTNVIYTRSSSSFYPSPGARGNPRSRGRDGSI